jgi:hypothetical protein
MFFFDPKRVGDERHYFALGRVERIIRQSASGKKKDWREPIDLRNLPASGNVLLIAQWYTVHGEDPHIYAFDDEDFKGYDAVHVITPLALQMEEQNGTKVFRLCEADKKVLDQHVIDRRGDTFESGDKEPARIVSLPAAACLDNDEGMRTVPGVSRSGRKTTSLRA